MNAKKVAQFKSLPVYKRVWTNRNLRMESIAAVGFDMDHTLALYNSATFEKLCFEMAVEKMIKVKKYPKEIGKVVYDRKAIIRGLIIDKRHGNILKLDAYGYVSRVRHGGKLLSRDEKRKFYKRGRIRLSPQRYRVVDTLFDLPEGSLYTELVALKDKHPELIPTSYRLLFDDIRESIDTIHRDGSLKKKIMADLPKYFIKDALLPKTLNKFKDSGKKLFLLTNSDAEYTGAVMDFILGSKKQHWEEYFDLVICSSGKPSFFLQKGKGKAIPKGKNRLIPNSNRNCFCGGDAFFLESKIGAIGDRILYFGDHTYGDILRSKKSVGWRTAMIVPEVESELISSTPVLKAIQDLEHVESLLEELHLEKDYQFQNGRKSKAHEVQEHIDFKLKRRTILQKKIAKVYNPYWGSIFREGRAASRFGSQVRDVACIYTSRVSNLSRYFAMKFFTSIRERMPHE